MSDPKPKEEKPAEPKPKGGGGVSPVVLVLTAILAAGGAFGGAKLGASQPAKEKIVMVEKEAEPPGPTVTVEPFVVAVADKASKPHAMRLTLALELKPHAKDEEFKAFVPRIRDSVLSYLRGLEFEDVQKSDSIDQLRTDIKERVEKLGATAVEHVLITDFVAQ